MEKEIKKIDKSRANAREIIADGKWGDKKEYNLIINTTGWNLKDLSNSLSEVIKKYFENK